MSQQKGDRDDLPTESLPVPNAPLADFSSSEFHLARGKKFGPYLIHRFLGRGGMGEVFEAENLDSGRRVALKILHGPICSAEQTQRFLREGRMAASLNHPNSVYIFGTETIEDTQAITMELVPGGTLKDRVKNRGPLPYAEAVDLLLQVIAGLEAAHKVGILHRDVKPANCFLHPDGTVKIGDFGLSISSLRTEESHLTASGSFLGTPSYASPEQLRSEDLDVRSDIYSVGATMYFLLLGQPPFDAPNLMKLLMEIAQKRPEAPCRLRPEIPAGLSHAVLRCLEKDPAKRYADYRQLRRALTPFSSAALAPARLPARLAAGVMDWALLTVLSMVLTSAWRHSPWHVLHLTLTMAGLNLMYGGILEGIWGKTPGKAVLGIRVAARDGAEPGAGGAMLRSGVFSFIWVVSNLSTFLPLQAGLFFNPWVLVSGAPFGLPLFLALTFLPAGKRNRLSGIHELVSGTNTVLEITPEPAGMEQPQGTGSPVPDAAKRIGPYKVLEPLGKTAAGELFLGFDEMLHRKVWIRTVAAASLPISEARRDLARTGRLRWLNGQRTPCEAWDSFEAPDGMAFLDAIGTRRSWEEVRRWMKDLHEEVQAGLTDGTLPRALGFDQIWITASGQMKLADFPVPSRSPADERFIPRLEDPTLRSVQSFLGQFTASALEGRVPGKDEPECTEPRAPLPIYVRSLLAELKQGSLENRESLSLRIDDCFQAEPAVSQSVRALQIGCYCLWPVFLLLTMLTLVARVDILIFWETQGSLADQLKIVLQGIAIGLGGLSIASVFRGDLVFRRTGAILVDMHGAPASRIRILVRSLLIWWLPWLLVFSTTPLPPAARGAAADSVAFFRSVLILLIFSGGALWSILFPMRGPADWLVGTFLVPGHLAGRMHNQAGSFLRRWDLLHKISLGTSTAIILLLALTGAFLCYRQYTNRRSLQSELERLQSAGEPVDLMTWTRGSSPVNETLQGKFQEWLGRWESTAWGTRGSTDPRLHYATGFATGWMTWLIGRDSAPPAVLLAQIAREKAWIDELVAFLNQGSIRIRPSRWYSRSDPAGRKLSGLLRFLEASSIRRRSVLVLGYACLLEPDPRPKLLAIEKLLSQNSPAASFSEWLDMVQGLALRDELVLLLEIRGVLPETKAESWLSREFPYFEWAADAQRGESLEALLAYRIEDLGAMTRIGDLRKYPRVLPVHPTLWSVLLREPALLADGIRFSSEQRTAMDKREEDDLRNRILLLPPPPASILFVPEARGLLSRCAESHNVERLRHLAVEVIRMARSQGSLPAEEAGLLPFLKKPGSLAAGGDDLRLRYEKLGPHRFRVSVDPQSAVPRYCPANWIQELAGTNRKSHFGESPSEPFWKNNNPFSLELEIENAVRPGRAF